MTAALLTITAILCATSVYCLTKRRETACRRLAWTALGTVLLAAITLP